MTRKAITVLGREISYEIKDVDIYSLEYYPENPRINYIISRTHPDKITQEFIEQELLKLDSTKERIKDIEENIGLLDEIYVLGNKVVEGNTRLCAFRRLHKKYPDAPHWKFIKARILQNGVTDEELFYILGTFHIKGKTEWDAYEKAAYIYKMIKVLKKNPEDVAKQLGKQRKTVESMLNAYETMSKKYLINSDNVEIVNGARDELKKYSYFEAFFLQKDLVNRVNETPAFLDEFVQWVKEDKFKKAQDVRELPKILGNKKACKTFYESDVDEAFDEAMHILYENKPEKVDRFYKKVREFREFLKEAEVLKVKTEIEENKNKKAELQQCYKDLKRFCKEAGLDIS
ncbi:MAG TPA: hypothetical protein ACFYD9_02915 [Candidatus Wunengus sp. YC64]|uniref:hypothetical protein n=1 Tax=Candidatus Wunengus sp. YC64 TaxID=3367700 RepID=UPI00402A2B77